MAESKMPKPTRDIMSIVAPKPSKSFSVKGMGKVSKARMGGHRK
jgi:hypothetical protein